MIGYVVLGTNDLARAASFYDELLAEMGVTRMMEFSGRGYAWAAAMDKPMLCIMKPFDGQPATVGNGVMAGIAADSRHYPPLPVDRRRVSLCRALVCPLLRPMRSLARQIPSSG